jgi:hypothetical protein
LAVDLWHHVNMVKRSSRITKRDDFQNQLRAVEEAIGASLTKNPAAVALGRRGGLKGGKARAKALTPEQRKAIAQQGGKAKAARWSKVK